MRRIRGIFIGYDGLRQIWVVVACLTVFFAVMFGGLYLSSVADENQCATVAQESGKKTRYVDDTCFVKIDGDYVPLDNWKVEEKAK